MADIVFDKFKEYVGDTTIDMDNDTLRAMLLADTYTPDSTDSVKADIVAHELAGASGYSTGGYALLNQTWADVSGVTKGNADDPIWTTATFTCRYCVVYSDTPTSPADPLICLLDLLANKTGLGGNFYINFHADGFVKLT